MRIGAPSGVVLTTISDELFLRPRLAADEAQHELVLVFVQTRRIDQIAAPDRVEQVGDRDLGLQQLRRVRADFELGDLAALHDDGRHAVHAVQPRFQLVGGELPQPRLRHACPR